jgi:hypothetical protein
VTQIIEGDGLDAGGCWRWNSVKIRRYSAVRRGHVFRERGHRIGNPSEHMRPESLGGVLHSVPDDDRYSPENLSNPLKAAKSHVFKRKP